MIELNTCLNAFSYFLRVLFIYLSVSVLFSLRFPLQILFIFWQTQHKVEMDKRDGKFGPQPMAVPPAQHMSRLDQPYPPTVGYPPPPAYGQPGGYPPQAQGYPGTGYPPAGYPPAGYQR